LLLTGAAEARLEDWRRRRAALVDRHLARLDTADQLGRGVPRLLILDEPTIGLNPIAQTSVREHITAVREPTGMTVPVTTHSMDEAGHYCDRVGLTHHGRIRALERAADPARHVPPGRDVRHARGPPRCGPDADRPCARLDQRSKGLNSLATAHSAHLTVH
jgi:energy-coupling factor transporter ATP-binding protein EcfA2